MVKDVKETIRQLTGTTAEDRIIAESRQEMENANTLLAKEIERSFEASGDASLSKHNSLVLRYNKAKEKLDLANKAKTEKAVKVRKLEKYLETLDSGPLTEWSGELWVLMVEKVVFKYDGAIELKLVDGRKIAVSSDKNEKTLLGLY